MCVYQIPQLSERDKKEMISFFARVKRKTCEVTVFLRDLKVSQRCC
jgi:hypothetical protein